MKEVTCLMRVEFSVLQFHQFHFYKRCWIAESIYLDTKRNNKTNICQLPNVITFPILLATCELLLSPALCPYAQRCPLC